MPLRSLYSTSEDLLTASVFERLAYLPPRHFISVLVQTFGLEFPHMVEPKVEMEFWPRWSDETAEKSYVEPDVFLRFTDEATGLRRDVIVEAKVAPEGNGQSAAQWQEQIEHYGKAVPDPEDPLLYLAIGGLGTNADSRARAIEADLTLMDGRHVVTRGRSWLDFRHGVQKLRSRDGVSERLVEDILRALDLAGHRAWLLFESLAPMQGHSFGDARDRLGKLETLPRE